ncbi:hypothetical protein HH303_05155 [Rhodospirillaceae bacterium KN72]|uniref:Nucleoside-diphosphate sugar epimerase n=2 Tax=Pacificispira spongiicola TaxID=2729598 RepID=A0A7Y0HG09_9PROT|nr:hypothetical protein [Pacificispira spongiicola]
MQRSAPRHEESATCWVMTDGRAGNLSSARGLAEVLGLPFSIKTIRLRRPWIWLPPSLSPPGILGAELEDGSPLAPPWPDLIITCGRRAIGPALEIKRRSGGHTKCVHIQHPRLDPARFDLVAVPAHDRLTGATVEVTTGSVHGITRARLNREADLWRDRLSHLPTPRVAVLIGGSNSAYRLDAETGRNIGAMLRDMAKATGTGLMVTGSRRTDPDAFKAVRNALADVPAEIWSGDGDNPYFGYLGLADRVIVTGDSVNMVSEAAATEKPVSVIRLPVVGRADKFERFHRAMEDAGAARSFDGTLADWDHRPLTDTARVAERVKALLSD